VGGVNPIQFFWIIGIFLFLKTPKSGTSVGSEVRAAGPDTEKLWDVYIKPSSVDGETNQRNS